MREIKFRVWDKKNKRMIPNHSINYLNERFETNLDDIFSMDLEIMQFTDLKDKNGKEIYEGDIVRHQGRLLQWFWDDRNSGFYYSPIKTIDKNAPFELWDHGEIVGNIYENAELLENEKS